ncbi:MAG TPA: hypothetical protein VHJ58_20675, partial [Vicinamibacterales bacterium]|nr:hypothetical protein [Vicinamibacterales bacterium]
RAFPVFTGHSAPPPQQSTPVRWRLQVRCLGCWLICAVVLSVVGAAPHAAEQSTSPEPLDETLRNVGRRIQDWYNRAQTVVSTETVLIQPLRADMSPDAFPRRLTFELRVEWDPERFGSFGLPGATVLREVSSINGRAPVRDRDSGCMDPKPVSPETLAILLPERLSESEFSPAGTTRLNGRTAVMIDYRGVVAREPEIAWVNECVTVSLPGRSRGRIWVDAATYDVLRIDDRLSGRFEFDVPREYIRRGAAPSMVIERAESSIRYARIEFDDPRESMMLPVSIDTVTVIRSTATQRTRITQRLSNHRRFLTEGRIVD